MDVMAVLAWFGIQPSEFGRMEYVKAQELARRLIEHDKDEREADMKMRVELFKVEQKNLGSMFSNLGQMLARVVR